MSRQLEQQLEERSRKQSRATMQAVYGGLESAVQHAGGVLNGITIKLNPGDCLFVIKASMPGGDMVAFIGADDMAGCFRKAQREAQRDALQWRVDKWA